MALFSSREGSIPKRKSKPKPNPFENYPDYREMKARISNGKMKPKEQLGFYLEEHMGAKLGLKHPARTATDSLRRFIKDAGLESDYYVEKYETKQPGVWAIVVTYDPPMATSKKVS